MAVRRGDGFQLREFLANEGFDCWPKLTGGTGLHLMAEIEPNVTHEQLHLYGPMHQDWISGTRRCRGRIDFIEGVDRHEVSDQRVHAATRASNPQEVKKLAVISGPSCIQATHLENDDSLQFSSCARPHFDPKMSFVRFLSSLARLSLGWGSRGEQ